MGDAYDQERDTCKFHEDNTKLLARVDSKLGTLIALLSAAIVMWFPVVVSGVVFMFQLSGRVAVTEKQVDLIKQQRNMDHSNKDRLL